VRYAAEVLTATAGNALHRSGLLQQRRLEPVGNGNDRYDLKLGYPSSHAWALDAVPDGATVLDIGSGPGGLAGEFARRGCQVTVVDAVPPIEVPPEVQVVVQDLDAEFTFEVAPFEHLLLLDVIEHLKDPEEFLRRLRAQFTDAPQHLVFSTPNIAFVVQRIMLAAGQFNYGRSGILDRTHTRLFTFRTARHLLRDAGFRITRVRGVPAPFPKAIGDNALSRWLIRLNLALISLSKTLFSYQIFIEASSTPEVSFRLRQTMESGRE
jgi:2-polyprenyl-3-methyl-5-hydroxy-6-metoxy-1,4-benzoquinol methylase